MLRTHFLLPPSLFSSNVNGKRITEWNGGLRTISWKLGQSPNRIHKPIIQKSWLGWIQFGSLSTAVFCLDRPTMTSPTPLLARANFRFKATNNDELNFKKGMYVDNYGVRIARWEILRWNYTSFSFIRTQFIRTSRLRIAPK